MVLGQPVTAAPLLREAGRWGAGGVTPLPWGLSHPNPQLTLQSQTHSSHPTHCWAGTGTHRVPPTSPGRVTQPHHKEFDLRLVAFLLYLCN